MVVYSLVPFCPWRSLTSVAAMECLVASWPEKAKLDPAGEIVKRSPTEPSLAKIPETIGVCQGQTQEVCL